MTQIARTPQPSKKRPGRPRGSAPFKAQDEALLRTAARDLAAEPGLNLTFLLRELRVTEEKDLSRLRRRWNCAGSTYLREARRELDTAREKHPLFALTAFLKKLDERSTSPSDLGPVRHMLAELIKTTHASDDSRRVEWDNWLGSTLSSLPAPASKPVVAIARFERRYRRMDKSLLRATEADRPSLSDGDRAYVLAVLLYERALELWAEEERRTDVQHSEN